MFTQLNLYQFANGVSRSGQSDFGRKLLVKKWTSYNYNCASFCDNSACDSPGSGQGPNTRNQEQIQELVWVDGATESHPKQTLDASTKCSLSCRCFQNYRVKLSCPWRLSCFSVQNVPMFTRRVIGCVDAKKNILLSFRFRQFWPFSFASWSASANVHNWLEYYPFFNFERSRWGSSLTTSKGWLDHEYELRGWGWVSIPDPSAHNLCLLTPLSYAKGMVLLVSRSRLFAGWTDVGVTQLCHVGGETNFSGQVQE